MYENVIPEWARGSIFRGSWDQLTPPTLYKQDQ